MKSVITYFIKNEIAANLLMVGILIMGVFGLLNMKSTFFPEVESKNINIQIVYPGASPEEIEEGVVAKIEENLKGLTGLEKVTSVSRENSGSINIEIKTGYDADLILQDVKNAVDQISSFPADMEPPVIYKVENLGFAISFGLKGDVELKTLKEFGRKVEDELLAIDGVSKVELSGFPDEEIEISFREADLRAYQISFAQATQAVRNANIEITGGTLKGEDEELLVRANNKSYYADGLRDVVVKQETDGGVIYLHQVADLKDKWADNPNRTYINGDPAVVITVQNTLEEDMLFITDTVRNYIERFNEENDIIQAKTIRDSSITLRQRISLLEENGIIGFILVLIFLAMFLHWRLAFWVALSIPISFAGMFVCAYFLDVTINVVSLFGMILVIGILVDDGIVISESIYQEHEKGVDRFKAALMGTMKVLPAVFSAIITTAIAFSTFFFIEGSLGDFFGEMAIVVIASLAFSLVEGAFILPTHVSHSKALDKDSKPNRVTELFETAMLWMRDKIYGKVLRFAMHNKLLIIAIMVGGILLTAGAFAGGFIKGTFFPVIERDNVAITLKMPAGTREHITQKWLDHLEAAAWEANEELSEYYFNNEKDAVLQVQKNLGPTTFEGNISITVLDGESRDSMKVRDVVNLVRQKAGPIYEAEVLTFGSQSIFGKPISISLIGDNYKELNEATERVKQEMSELAELTDVVDNNQEGLREINISLKEKAKFLGLNLQEVVGQVRQGFFGSEVQRLQRGRDEVRVWVRYGEQDRKNLNQLKDMRVRFTDGREFPLAEIANLNIERGVIAINHIDGKREIKVEADILNDEVSVSDLTATVKEDLVPNIIKDFPTVSAIYEGQNEEQEKSQKSLQATLPVIFLLMFFTIALTFRSISQTLVLLSLIPFGFIGVGLGHFVLGLPISLFSILGVIALVGILVNDGLVFVTTYNKLIEEGAEQMEAIYEAGISRFRPILLTSITTIIGLAPLLLEKSLQAQFLIPMAASVAFGLLVMTVILLVLLPVLLIVANRIKVYSLYLWEGIKPGLETVEPAFLNRKSYFLLWLLAGVISVGGFMGVIYGFFMVVGNIL